MKKEEIYVVIGSEHDRILAIKILNEAGEKIWRDSSIFDKNYKERGEALVFDWEDHNEWRMSSTLKRYRTSITLDELKEILKDGTKIEKHELKTWPTFFEEVNNGKKKFEVRKNDRNFKVGDILILREYEPLMATIDDSREGYTGRSIEMEVTYIVYGPQFGIRDGYCVMSLIPVK